MDLSGQTAIVTGGSKGLGKSIVQHLAKYGASIAVIDIDAENGERLVDEMNKQGQPALFVKADVTVTAEVQSAVERIRSHFGKIDILVNNAGWDKIEPFLESSEETWIRIVDINLLSQLRMARAVVPLMIEQGYGRVINIASDAGRVGSSGEVTYSSAKGGVIAFTKGLAREVAKYAITVNCVAPGPIRTPLYEEVARQNPKLAAALEKAIPFRRPGETDEIAHIVTMIAAREASYITGQTISVSGGLTMI
jgi:2-hydroxycyclohexanecarboxyl-CoA dehydrogenase